MGRNGLPGFAPISRKPILDRVDQGGDEKLPPVRNVTAGESRPMAASRGSTRHAGTIDQAQGHPNEVRGQTNAMNSPSFAHYLGLGEKLGNPPGVPGANPRAGDHNYALPHGTGGPGGGMQGSTGGTGRSWSNKKKNGAP